MSWMFEVMYTSPADPQHEAVISDCVGKFGGRLTYREEPETIGAGPVCLTYEFGDVQIARQAAARLRSEGEHVEGPADYGN